MGDDNRYRRDDGRRRDTPYRELLPKALFTLVGLFLIAGGALLDRYAVERTDEMHVILVLLAFLPMACGGFLLAYTLGLFS